MFNQLQKYFDAFAQGPITLNSAEIYQVDDAQIEEFDQKFDQIENQQNEPNEESFNQEEEEQDNSLMPEFEEQHFGDEEEEVEDTFNAFDPNNNPNDVAMALEVGESESESEKEQLTPYQQQRQKLFKLIQSAEDALLSPKDWKYQGETTSSQRPNDALINDMPEFDVKRKLPLEIDAQINAQIEELLKLRIIDKKFDNPVYIHNEVEAEKEKLSFNKSEKTLGDQIQQEVQGQRLELSAAVKELRSEVKLAVQELEAELRSYFVQYMIVK